MFLSYLYFNPFKHFPKSVPKNERISPKTSFLLPKMVLGIFLKIAGTLDSPSDSCVFTFSQKCYFQKPLCRLTNPVSVFLTNSVSVSPNFCPTFLTSFRTGISFKIFLTNILNGYSFKVFVNARKY